MPRAALLALLLTCVGAAQADEGPSVAFERKGALVCARYALTARHHLYPARLAALAGSARATLKGVPAGKTSKDSPEPFLDSPFVACAEIPGPARWVDQSCLAEQGVCLPPRGFVIDAQGKASALSPAQASQAFNDAFVPKASGWGSLLFKPR